MTNALLLAKEQAVVAINAFHAQTLKALTGDATNEERDTWATKEAAAKAFMKNEASSDQVEMLTIEASFTDGDTIALALTIIHKTEVMHRLIGLASGFRRKSLNMLDQCPTEEAVGQLLASLSGEANQLIQSYMT